MCIYPQTHARTHIHAVTRAGMHTPTIQERIYKKLGNSVSYGQGNWMTGVLDWEGNSLVNRTWLDFVLNPICYFLSSLLIGEFNPFIIHVIITDTFMI